VNRTQFGLVLVITLIGSLMGGRLKPLAGSFVGNR